MMVERPFLCMPAFPLAELVLLRHGIAEPRIGGQDHPDRGLSSEGRDRTEAVVAALVQRGLQLDLLVSSPFRRALETAQIALKAGLAPLLDINPNLRPGDDAGSLVKGLSGRVGLVGHEPDLGNLACLLTGLPTGALKLKKAGLVQLRQSSGQWQLRALLTPGLLL